MHPSPLVTLLRFREGDRLLHRFNPDLGPGRVESVDGRRITVSFPRDGTVLTLAGDDTALKPVSITPGLRVTVIATGQETTTSERIESEGEPSWRLADGSVVADAQLWPSEIPSDPLERLASFETDRVAAFRTRLDAVLLQRTRQAKGLGTFLGGRLAIFPHQLHVAERATASEPVRWLLADEVGLGKTIEACLILSRLLRTGRADRTLVVAPATLTVQWLGELWRKFHQVFVLLDRRRREDVEKDFGGDFNPFEAHRRSIVSIEDLALEPDLSRRASDAGLDLLVVDEAHRLERGAHDRGNDAYRAIAPLTRAARHVLLLSATPLEADAEAFFRLLELLRPEAYESLDAFLAALGAGKGLPPCTSATRRVDIGGLPPRVAMPVDLPQAPAAEGLSGDPLVDRDDPRVTWLAAKAPEFLPGGREEGKTLVFCHDLPALTALKTVLESVTRRRVSIFHEELTPERRDLEVAGFRRSDGPVILVSTECGGEGRNFEFCRRLVLFDLPPDPAAVEQRIGRLDRINRTRPVEIVYFRPPEGFGRDLAALYERIGLFREPLGGLERSLASVAAAIAKGRRKARAAKGSLDVDALVAEVRVAAEARQGAVYHHLHAGGYHGDLGEEILSRVPAGLDAANERFVLGAAALHGFTTAEKSGRRTWYLEFGAESLIEHLPGVSGGSRWLGTFDREEGVEKEELDFFASGHPLVEGLLQEMEDGFRGRVALARLPKAGLEAAGVLFVTRVGPEPKAAFLDLSGRSRPELATLAVRRRHDLKGISPDEWFGSLTGRAAEARRWPKVCRVLGEKVLSGAFLEAVAAIRFLR